ncbi:MAG: hypothetical protein ACEQSH_00645 [Bacteroidia bacterium]
MSRYQIHRDLDATLAEYQEFANRRTGPRSTPIRPADPVHNALLENARDYKPKPSAEAATVWAVCGGLIVVAAVKAMPYVIAAVVGTLWTVGLLGLVS